MAQAREGGFALLAIPIVIGVLLLGSVTVAVVSSDQKAQQAGQEVKEKVQKAAENLLVVGKRVESSPTPWIPSIQGNVNPKDSPISFCNQNPSFCSGNTVNTDLLCGQNPTFCTQRGIMRGESIPFQVPVHGNINPKQNPDEFCKLNPLHCLGNQVNTTTLCAGNPSFCAQNQILPGQRIIPQQQVQQNKFLNPMLNPDINPMANPNINPMVNPKINPYANPQINPYVNPKIFPMGPPAGIPKPFNPF